MLYKSRLGRVEGGKGGGVKGASITKSKQYYIRGGWGREGGGRGWEGEGEITRKINSVILEEVVGVEGGGWEGEGGLQ